MKLKDKYIFRQYNPLFPKLFEKEAKRLRRFIGNKVLIEHVGSTAVPGLGGKGVIDILISTPKKEWPKISEELTKANYTYKKKGAEREKQRLFFMANLPDTELGSRIYHIHLTYTKSPELKRMTAFRDYLIKNADALREYSKIKMQAAKKAQKLLSKDEMRDSYGDAKENFIKRLLNTLRL